MRKTIRRLGAIAAAAALAALGWAGPAGAQDKVFKVGVVFDYTGPLAGGGSKLNALGVKTVIDYFREKGPIEGYRIEAVYADAQSKPDVAINEAVRLLEQEKVDAVMGFFSSAQCVPVAARVEQMKKFMWITTCISSAVLADRHFKYIFRPQASGLQWGTSSADFIAHYAQSKFGKAPKDLRLAIIHEDGAYGVDVSSGAMEGAKKNGLNVVLKEGYSATAPDLSSLVTKLKRARPDVIFHVGYNPDITLFLRQARELGLRFKALVGEGAGYGVPDKLRETFGKDFDYFFDVDPISIWATKQDGLSPELRAMIKYIGDAYEKAEPGTTTKSAHVGFGASNAYVFFADVLPRAIRKYGGVDAEALRRAALDTDIPENGTMLGFGVKFAGEGDRFAGQNLRAFPVITQFIGNEAYVVWPPAQMQREAVLPLPPSSPYALH